MNVVCCSRDWGLRVKKHFHTANDMGYVYMYAASQSITYFANT